MIRVSTTASSSFYCHVTCAGKFRGAAGIFAARRSFSTSLHASLNPLGWSKSKRTFRCVFPEQISKPSWISTISANMSSPSKVVEHVVFFNVKEGTPPEKANAMISALQGLKSLDTVLQLTAGPALNFRSETYRYTHALYSRYKDKQSLDDYSACPQHMDVVKQFVLPIVDDIFALDWEAEIDGPVVSSSGAVRVAVFKPKDDMATPQRFELVEILSGYKSLFPSIGQVSFGENFSPARAKGFTWGFLSLFPGVKELEEFNKNDEHIKLQCEKILPQMENYIIVDMLSSPSSASL
uniref:Stress-response A/B barrel domain-containing protein n=1 Tax=Araucaria cunninghamii TaxID=56994 RepID=A0A0D6R407_ARACU